MSSDQASLVAADWGTTNLRIWLVDASGEIVAERSSEQGISTTGPNEFEKVFEAELAAINAPADLPAVICGMAGSRQGWIEAPYFQTPVGLAEIATGAVEISNTARPILVIPGVAQGGGRAPDVMRGEETQLAGIPAIASGNHWVCLPGTHCKWVQVSGGIIERFKTFMTGELFSALSGATVLRHSVDRSTSSLSADDPVYLKWVDDALAAPEMLTSRLFEIRAGGLIGDMQQPQAAAALSGLLIGTEIGAAKRLLGPDQHQVRLVASGSLAALYRAALERSGLNVEMSDGNAAVRAGLLAAAQTGHIAQKPAIGE